MFHYFNIKFHFSFFTSLRFKFFASLHLSNFRFEAKQGAFFRIYFVFSFFFVLNFSLRFDLVIFASKRNKAKRNSSLFFIFSLFFHFFSLFSLFSLFFHFFSLNFRFASIFSLNFCLFYNRFRFRFLLFRIEVNHVKSGFFFASKRNEIFASISNFASEAKVRANPTTILLEPPPREYKRTSKKATNCACYCLMLIGSSL